MAAPTSTSGARTPPQNQQFSARTQNTTPDICPNGRAPHQNAPLRRLQPLSGAAAFQGVIGESKEDLGGNRNPPNPPWPPEAATRWQPQAQAAQGCAAKPTVQRQNAKPRKTPLPGRQRATPERTAPPRKNTAPNLTAKKGEAITASPNIYAVRPYTPVRLRRSCSAGVWLVERSWPGSGTILASIASSIHSGCGKK